MCFVVHPNYPDPLIAEQDIVCYKVGTASCDKESFFSEYQDYKYKLNELQPVVELSPDPFYGNRCLITAGYHSYHPDHVRLELCQLQRNTYVVVKCIIPKGATYYYDPLFLEYVSTQIIAQEIL